MRGSVLGNGYPCCLSAPVGVFWICLLRRRPGFSLCAGWHARSPVPSRLDPPSDPDVEARYALESLLGVEAVVHRGHEGVREAFQAYSDTMASCRYEFSEFRDLGDRVVAIGRFRTAGGRAASRPSPRSPTSSTSRTAK
jgi:hypothetical protein